MTAGYLQFRCSRIIRPDGYSVSSWKVLWVNTVRYLTEEVQLVKTHAGLLKNNKFLEQTRRFFGNTYLEYNPISWMNVRYQIGVDTYSTDNENVYEAGSAATGQALPTQAQYPTPTNPVYGYRAPTGGSINNYGVMRSVVNSLLNVTFNKDITPDLNLLFIVGNEFNDSHSRSWNMTGTGFVVPGWQNMSNTTTQTADEAKAWQSCWYIWKPCIAYRSMLYLKRHRQV